MSEVGNLYVISAPSGTGKTTLVKALVDSLSNITVSISHTTRPKRPLEKDGINYHFVEDSEFKEMIERKEFLEYATVFKHLYGTSRSWVESTLQRGIDVILEIDWQGSQQIQLLFPECVSIFLFPPSLAILSERLKNRNQDHPEIIQQRLADVREVIQHIADYDYLIVNDVFENAIEDLTSIIRAGRLQKNRQIPQLAKLINDLSNA